MGSMSTQKRARLRRRYRRAAANATAASVVAGTAAAAGWSDAPTTLQLVLMIICTVGSGGTALAASMLSPPGQEKALPGKRAFDGTLSLLKNGLPNNFERDSLAVAQ